MRIDNGSNDTNNPLKTDLWLTEQIKHDDQRSYKKYIIRKIY
ncbi:MAG: hypothetical protein FKGGLIKP_00081 [Sodalis sp. Fse]|nr:MAG: hypothetical protein FKGGLIKP_00081 [Sodalis sp. Fse]